MRKLAILSLLVLSVGFFNFTVDDREEGLMKIATVETDEGSYTLNLPTDMDDYSYVLPAYYEEMKNVVGPGPDGNNFAIENEAATLGRVLFYDRNLSLNKTLSCGGCHNQQAGFAENKQFSGGFNQQLASRNTLSFGDLDFAAYDKLFWDDRESNLVDMLIQPIAEDEEMGIDPDQLLDRLNGSTIDGAPNYYKPLFEQAFGTEEITMPLIGDALAHFVKSVAAVDTKLDQAIQNNLINNPGGSGEWTASEELGRTIFQQDCQACHTQIMTDVDYEGVVAIFNTPHNTGLDLTTTDAGVGAISGIQNEQGMFKTPTLKNVAQSGPYMHDGRFETLEEVVEFYSEGMKLHPNSAFNPGSAGQQVYYSEAPPLPESSIGFEYSEEEKSALVDFMEALSDHSVLNDAKFSDPWIAEEGDVGIANLAELNVDVYPNPAQDAVTIELGTEFSGNTDIHIYNVTGSLVRSEAATGDIITIERGALANGTYLVKLVDADKSGMTKVVFR